MPGSKPEYGIVASYDVMVEMRDGVRLANRRVPPRLRRTARPPPDAFRRSSAERPTTN